MQFSTLLLGMRQVVLVVVCVFCVSFFFPCQTSVGSERSQLILLARNAPLQRDVVPGVHMYRDNVEHCSLLLPVRRWCGMAC